MILQVTNSRIDLLKRWSSCDTPTMTSVRNNPSENRLTFIQLINQNGKDIDPSGDVPWINHRTDHSFQMRHNAQCTRRSGPSMKCNQAKSYKISERFVLFKSWPAMTGTYCCALLISAHNEVRSTWAAGQYPLFLSFSIPVRTWRKWLLISPIDGP